MQDDMQEKRGGEGGQPNETQRAAVPGGECDSNDLLVPQAPVPADVSSPGSMSGQLIDNFTTLKSRLAISQNLRDKADPCSAIGLPLTATPDQVRARLVELTTILNDELTREGSPYSMENWKRDKDLLRQIGERAIGRHSFVNEVLPSLVAGKAYEALGVRISADEVDLERKCLALGKEMAAVFLTQDERAQGMSALKQIGVSIPDLVRAVQEQVIPHLPAIERLSSERNAANPLTALGLPAGSGPEAVSEKCRDLKTSLGALKEGIENGRVPSTAEVSANLEKALGRLVAIERALIEQEQEAGRRVVRYRQSIEIIKQAMQSQAN